jgi:hypothetical protein
MSMDGNGGTVTRTYSVTDAAGNAINVTQTFTITGNDTEAPEVTCGGTIVPVSADGECMATVADLLSSSSLAVTDNCDPDPTLTQSPTPAPGSDPASPPL